jgi:hypothetical protein
MICEAGTSWGDGPILKSFQRAKESWNKKPKCRFQAHSCDNLQIKPRIVQPSSFILHKPISTNSVSMFLIQNHTRESGKTLSTLKIALSGLKGALSGAVKTLRE